MPTTLDECDDVLDWMEGTFDIVHKALNIRIREEKGEHFIRLLWYAHDRPQASMVYPPDGWAITRWLRNEAGWWESDIYKVK